MELSDGLRRALDRYLSAEYVDDIELELDILYEFGIFDPDGMRRSATLCINATRKILFGWSELGCEGNRPSQSVDAAAHWVRTGEKIHQWPICCLPAPAIRCGEVIGDCDINRVGPIAAAAARTVYYIETNNIVDAALVLCDVEGAIDEGVKYPNAMPFRQWIADIAVPASLECRLLTEDELSK